MQNVCSIIKPRKNSQHDILSVRSWHVTKLIELKNAQLDLNYMAFILPMETCR